MTLREWSERYRVAVSPHMGNKETYCVMEPPEWAREDSPARWDLFHLSDYAVSSVCGPVLYLAKRADG